LKLFSQIISKILKTLFLKDLKNLRLVNTFLFEETKKYFYTRASLNLFLLQEDNLFRFGEGFVSYHESYKLHKNIYLPSESQNPNFSPQEFMVNVLDFADLLNPTIKSLHVERDVSKVDDILFLTSLLNNCPQLEELTMDIYINNLSHQVTPSFLSNVKNPLTHLKKLKFGIVFTRPHYLLPSWPEEDRALVKDWCKNLLKLTPNLENLSITEPQLVEFLLKEMLELQQEEMPLRNLVFLNLYEVKSPILDLVLGLQQPLKGLELIVHLKEAWQGLEEVLEKNCNTLETLVVTYTPHKMGTIHLPDLPRLKTLTIRLHRENCKNIFSNTLVIKY
jgi:hypothetical protein